MTVEAYCWFGGLAAVAEGAVALQRAIGDRLHVPCQRMQTDDGQQVYRVVLVGHEGTVSDACAEVEREVLRWREENAVGGSLRVERLHAWRDV